MNRLSKAEALLRLQQLCSHAEKPESEIRKKLAQWELKDAADDIIATLKKDDFLNPLRFSLAFVHDKITFNKWGKIKIRYYLHGYHIPEPIIEQAFSEVDEQDYQEMIMTELKKKKKSIGKADPYKLKAKLFAFGNQRGYESELIMRFLTHDE